MFRTAILLLMPAVVHAALPLANPVTFESCRMSVAASNPDLLSAQESLRSQEELAAGSYSAFFPSVNASLGMTRTSPGRTLEPQALSSLGVSYNLFSGFGIGPGSGAQEPILRSPAPAWIPSAPR